MREGKLQSATTPSRGPSRGIPSTTDPNIKTKYSVRVDRPSKSKDFSNVSKYIAKEHPPYITI
jgi:hypothetical protein